MLNQNFQIEIYCTSQKNLSKKIYKNQIIMQKKILGILGIMLLFVTLLHSFNFITISAFEFKLLLIFSSILILYSLLLDEITKRKNKNDLDIKK
jgi:uncharacterized membrane protein